MKLIKKTFLIMGIALSIGSLGLSQADANKPVVYYDDYNLDEAVGLKPKTNGNSSESEQNEDLTNQTENPSENTREDEKNSDNFIEATISKVIDGDTVTVNVDGKDYKLRMIGVDTPETVHPSKPVEYFGKEASDFSKKTLTGRKVYLEKDTSNTDRYNRLLRYIWLEKPESLANPTRYDIENLMFNGILLREGFANAASFPPDVKYQAIFKEIEKEAEAKGKGLWGEKSSQDNPSNEDIETTPEENDPSNGSNKDYQKENESDPLPEYRPGSDNTSNPNFKFPAGNRPIIGQATSMEESRGKKYLADTTQGPIKANRISGIYHTQGQRGYDKISVVNVTWFESEADALEAGYRKAKR